MEGQYRQLDKGTLATSPRIILMIPTTRVLIRVVITMLPSPKLSLLFSSVRQSRIGSQTSRGRVTISNQKR